MHVSKNLPLKLLYLAGVTGSSFVSYRQMVGLPSVQLFIERVAERVKHGGHDIVLTSIARRYPRSIGNLIRHYAPLCDSVLCLDNSQKQEKVIFTQTQQDIIIQNKIIYQTIIERART